VKRNRNAVKHPLPPEPNAQCEMEIARRRTLHHLHDGGRILSEALHFTPSMEARKALTEIVGQIQTLERRLADLKEAL
jgi:hypothetical protein